MIVCLFDIDGTLLASGGAGKAALESALTEEFGIALRDCVPYAGRTDRAIIRDLFRIHDIPDTPENLDRILGGYLRRLPDSLRRHDGKVLPGIENLLRFLKWEGSFAVGLLTGNVRSGAQTKLGHFGLFEHFAFGGFGDLHFERDDVAREALGRVHHHVGADVAPDRIWVIGDTPLDVKCARAIGAKVAAVATGMHTVEQLQEHGPDIVLADLADPRPLLHLWDA
jgi:phosphoglycolate phosphatase-like HAD superfamily hydrolase